MSTSEIMDADFVPDDNPISIPAVQAVQALSQIPARVSDALVLQRDPNDMLAEAAKAAKALMAVMASKPDKVMMNGQQYIESEDWQTIGHFYGCSAHIESDGFVEFGDVKGWEATAVLVARDGRVLGRATAMCLNDEEKWSSRPKKVWAYCLGAGEHDQHEHSVDDPGQERLVWEQNPTKPGRNRPRKAQVVVGVAAVPMFQLRSMAQTRASSKAHRMVLAFVPVLAGFSPTPAEEMPDAERVPNSTTPANAESNSVRSGGAQPMLASQPPAGVVPSQSGDSGQVTTDEGPDLEVDLPPGARLIRSVNPARHGASCEIEFTNGERYLSWNKKLPQQAEEWRLNRVPVFPDYKVSASGNKRIEHLVPVPVAYNPDAPEEAF